MWFQYISVISVIWVLFLYIESHTSGFCFAAKQASNIHMPSLPNQVILHLGGWTLLDFARWRASSFVHRKYCFCTKTKHPSPICPSQLGLETARKSDSEIFWDFSCSRYVAFLCMFKCSDGWSSPPASSPSHGCVEQGICSILKSAMETPQAKQNTIATLWVGKGINKLTTSAGIGISLKENCFAFG